MDQQPQAMPQSVAKTATKVNHAIHAPLARAKPVTVMAARSGDVNLDGVIDLLDVAGFIAADRFDSGAPAGWSEGDFNGDGLVDLLDAAEMATSGLYDAGPYATPVASIAPVPEPSAPLVLLLAPILAGVIGVGRFTAAQRSCRARSRRLLEARIVA